MRVAQSLIGGLFGTTLVELFQIGESKKWDFIHRLLRVSVDFKVEIACYLVQMVTGVFRLNQHIVPTAHLGQIIRHKYL